MFLPPIVPPLCCLIDNDRLLHLTSNVEDVAMHSATDFMKTTKPSKSVRLIGTNRSVSETQ